MIVSVSTRTAVLTFIVPMRSMRFPITKSNAW
jgi:hypothetical protein